MNRFALVMLLVTGCSAWTKQDTNTAVDIGKAILCAIEHAELDDPQLNQLCGELGIDGKKALAAHRTQLARSVAKAKTVCKPDGGAP